METPRVISLLFAVIASLDLELAFAQGKFRVTTLSTERPLLHVYVSPFGDTTA